MVPSPKVATYDLQPEMSAPELAAKAEAAIRAGAHDLIVLNFANADMVGHTGSLPAAIRACEAVDAGLGRVVAAVRGAGGALLVTADHGNADEMLEEDGSPDTAHSLNPVPFVVVAAVHESGGACVITADHGNCDHMLEPDGSPNTAHSLNPVPVIVTVPDLGLRDGGVLADVAPTILQLLGVEQPPQMTGRSLIEPTP